MKNNLEQVVKKIALYSFLGIMLQVFTINAMYADTIRGRVTDAKTQEPLIGANVVIKPFLLGASTDVAGMYSIDIPSNLIGEKATLEVSYVGYIKVTLEITLDKDVVQNISLKEDILLMNTVVVTGMGVEMEKQKLGVTIGNVSAESIDNSKAIDAISALQGKVANVEITSSSGEPGASSYIRIRGSNSITGGTQPLIVVDGSPIDNSEIGTSTGGYTQSNRASDINPKDIESIDILKGPAAAAMYGSRAQNGVILIKTKSGKPGKPKVTYDVSYSFDEVTNVQPLQQIYGQGNKGVASPTAVGAWGPLLTEDIPTYNHEREMFQTGHTLNNNLSISGGNEWTTYFLSAGQTSTQSTLIGNSEYLRNSVRLKASQRINEDINVTGNIQFVDINADKIRKGSSVSGLLTGSWRTPPDFNNSNYIDPITGLHRSYRYQNPTILKKTRGYDNPFFIAYEGLNNSKVARTFGNIKVDYDPLNWLNISYILGHDYSNDERITIIPPSSSYRPNGQIIAERLKNQETDGNLLITAKRDFDFADAKATLLLGQNMNERKYSYIGVTGDDMAVYDFQQLDNTAASVPDEYESTRRTESYFGQLTFDIFNQLYFTAGLRNDGSSTFGKSKSRHWYPKFSTAWEFSKLSIFSNHSDWFNFGKLHLAYGEAGQEPEVYSTITGFSSSPTAFGDGWAATLTSNAYGYSGFYTSLAKGQDNILPQRSKEIEMGINLAFLDERVGIELTYYNSKTTDAIYSLPLSPSTGSTSQVQNAGVIQNKGIEAGISFQPINIPNFKWDINLLYASNENKVLELPGADFISLGSSAIGSASVIEGQPYGVIRGTDYLRFGRGVIYNGVNIDEAYSGWKTGDLYITDTGYPVKDPELRIIGDPNPDWTGSIRTSFTLFNNIEISALFDFSQGGEVSNGTLGALMYFGTAKETENRGQVTVFDGKGPGAGKEVELNQAYYQGIGSSFNGPASLAIEDGSYVKLREIAIAYTLRNELLKSWISVSSVDIRLSARNLHTWTNYKGIDPETNLAGTVNARGFDYFNNPQTRSIILSLRFNY
ncbi:MAG: SusC/RagA family TonB-linked outer membrane protein [Bacteroidetes bacterium]|nr:SusC/RagA family TonB-linked outer membrane protein [Bacteroidota bacterium]MBU1799363.1 SusC/RagA family TonB-linked outer membrane protein [Bacteroidota bacterium]